MVRKHSGTTAIATLTAFVLVAMASFSAGTSRGRFIGVWGEGDSDTGPGGVWIDR